MVWALKLCRREKLRWRCVQVICRERARSHQVVLSSARSKKVLPKDVISILIIFPPLENSEKSIKAHILAGSGSIRISWQVEISRYRPVIAIRSLEYRYCSFL